jgi:hypothetical protein
VILTWPTPRRNPLRASFRTVCTGHARRAAHGENRRRNHLSDARGVRSHRSSSAKINHFRQRHRLRPARPAQDHARHDDLVVRRLCLMAKRRHRKRQWTFASTAAAPPGYRPQIRQEIVLTTDLTPRKCLASLWNPGPAVCGCDILALDSWKREQRDCGDGIDHRPRNCSHGVVRRGPGAAVRTSRRRLLLATRRKSRALRRRRRTLRPRKRVVWRSYARVDVASSSNRISTNRFQHLRSPTSCR